jgi:nucleotide-binding universal stress UspA family protein
MKKILVATDGSDAALKGARAAFELARPFGAQVTVLAVVPPIVLPGDAPWAPLDEIHQGELKRGERVVSETLAALGETALNVSTRVMLGPVAETITEVAESGAFDLVVLGSHGKGTVKRVLLGSVADRVMHLCTRPVLIVP